MPALIAFITADDATFTRVRELLEGRGLSVQRRQPSPSREGERPDVVVLDADLADADAPAVLGRLGGPGERPPVLVIGSRDGAEAVVACIRAGAEDAMFKPLDSLGLPVRVEALLQRRALEEARESVQTLEYRNQELEAFIYIVTHDMKTPVVNLQGLVGLLEQDHGESLPQEGLEYLGRLRRNAERLEELLRDLLEYPRRLSVLGPLRPHDVGNIVHAALDGLAPVAEQRGVDVVVTQDLPTVPCDPKRIQQVFHNLIDNGIKHAQSDGAARVEVGWTRSADGIRFHVRDNGRGIPKDQLSDVFRPFHRVPGTAAEGTGIGLAVSRHLVEAHGGEIWCESREGEGTTVYFTLGRAA